MKRKSSLIGVAALALLLTSAMSVGAMKADTLYTLYVSCTNPVYGFVEADYKDSPMPKQAVHNTLKYFIEDRDCVKNTVEYAMTPYQG